LLQAIHPLRSGGIVRYNAGLKFCRLVAQPEVAVMTFRSAWLPLLLAACCCSTARGQLAGTVQLPSFNIFTVETTVSVPDSGGAYVGGFGRRFSTGARQGPWSRGGGAGAGASGVHVTTRIIDHAEHDRLTLRGGADDAEQDEFTRKLADADDSTAGRPAEGVAAIRRRKAAENAAAAAELRAEGEEHFRRGLQAESAGRLAGARSHYFLAARKLDGEARREALERLSVVRAALDAPTTEEAVLHDRGE
jgi:hypothetical protein